MKVYAQVAQLEIFFFLNPLHFKYKIRILIYRLTQSNSGKKNHRDRAATKMNQPLRLWISHENLRRQYLKLVIMDFQNEGAQPLRFYVILIILYRSKSFFAHQVQILYDGALYYVPPYISEMSMNLQKWVDRINPDGP
ncbi:hypothetical protein RCL_jg9816.t1 [Rhizophagus clarus]|uniref:Uncharacterized protein n=1 Tax=Rhizophagus clarus TaxID=94130 RepID=A0A8H3M2J5_9GLOM|nr:hypothetical protein RCL_jg9816.t1 [Rhizophagus clarus]